MVRLLYLLIKDRYEKLGLSYQKIFKIFEYCRRYKLKPLIPICEKYLKGPGLIFRGNTDKYIPKIIIFYNNINQR